MYKLPVYGFLKKENLEPELAFFSKKQKHTGKWHLSSHPLLYFNNFFRKKKIVRLRVLVTRGKIILGTDDSNNCD